MTILEISIFVVVSYILIGIFLGYPLLSLVNKTLKCPNQVDEKDHKLNVWLWPVLLFVILYGLLGAVFSVAHKIAMKLYHK